MTATPGQDALREAARVDDPWAFDLKDRIALARSILGHADETCWRRQVARALAALEGQSIEKIGGLSE